MNDIYTTDVRVICEFADGSERSLILNNFARRSSAGHVTWDRPQAGQRARFLLSLWGLSEPIAMRMSLVKHVNGGQDAKA